MAFAQSPTQRVPSAEGDQPRVELSETFELNIPDRRIIERNFESSTAVELNAPDRNDLRVHVGVALRADTIDVRLRNVTGSVRFHGSLQRILNLLDLRIKATPSQ